MHNLDFELFFIDHLGLTHTIWLKIGIDEMDIKTSFWSTKVKYVPNYKYLIENLHKKIFVLKLNQSEPSHTTIFLQDFLIL